MTTPDVDPSDPCQGMHNLEPEAYEGATRRGPAGRVRMVCAGCGGRVVLDINEDPEGVRVLN